MPGVRCIGSNGQITGWSSSTISCFTCGRRCTTWRTTRWAALPRHRRRRPHKSWMQLPKRAAAVRSGDADGVIYTHQTHDGGRSVADNAAAGARVRQQTRDHYCHPRYEVEHASGGSTTTSTAATQSATGHPAMPTEGEIKIRRHPGANYKITPGRKRWEDV